MLIYIRHGTSALQSKSAEKWSEAEKAKHPPLNFAKSLDYLIKEWQALEHLIKRQTLVLENKNSLGLLHVKIDSTDSSGPGSGYKWWCRWGRESFGTRDSVWRVPSGTKIETAGRFNDTAAPGSISACVWACLFECASASISVSFLMGDHEPQRALLRKYQGLIATIQGGVWQCVCLCLYVSLQINTLWESVWWRVCVCVFTAYVSHRACLSNLCNYAVFLPSITAFEFTHLCVCVCV